MHLFGQGLRHQHIVAARRQLVSFRQRSPHINETTAPTSIRSGGATEGRDETEK